MELILQLTTLLMLQMLTFFTTLWKRMNPERAFDQKLIMAPALIITAK